MQPHTEHFHVSIETEGWPAGSAFYSDIDESLHAFVSLSNNMFATNDDDVDTRVTLEECYEALDQKPKIIFVGAGSMRVTWTKCPGCASPLLN